MNRIIFIILCLTLQSCVASVAKNGGSIGDALFTFDEIQTSSQHPVERSNFIPTDNELKYIRGSNNVKRLENNYFYCTTKFDTVANSVKQKTSEDCWAACSVMLLNHERVKLTPSELSNLIDKLTNAKQSENEGKIFCNLINHFKKASYCNPITAEMFINSILNEHPMLVGFKSQDQTEGHIKVVISFYYFYINPTSADKFAGRKVNMAIDRIILIDPADGKEQEISGDEFKRDAVFAVSFLPELSSSGFFKFKF